MDEAKRARVIEVRILLRERFRSHETPSMADATPLGPGPPNRHAMPQLPPDQIATTKWLVLELGQKPEIAKARWKLTVDGACRRPLALDWTAFSAFSAFSALEQVSDVSDFHCVTTSSRLSFTRGTERSGSTASS